MSLIARRWYARIKSALVRNQKARSSMLKKKLKVVPINEFCVIDPVFVLIFLNDTQFLLGV